MTRFVLNVTRFDQVVDRHSNGQPKRLIKRREGDVIDNLSTKDEVRLLASGAISPLAEVSSEADGRPRNTASKKAWVDYAVSTGLDRDEAEGLDKQELIEALS